MSPQVRTLHENKWVSLLCATDLDRGVDGFVYSHETRCDGKIVAVLPFRLAVDGENTGRAEFLLHSENNPAWGWGPNLASVTGGQEHKQPWEDVLRELAEETGYRVHPGVIKPLGTCRGVKSTDTVYSLYAADLTGVPQGSVDADSLLEATEHPEWVGLEAAMWSPDPLVSVMLVRWLARSSLMVPAARHVAGEIMRWVS